MIDCKTLFCRAWTSATQAVKDALLGAILVGSFFLLVQLSYWLLWPYKTADVVEPMQVLNTDHIVERGDQLQVEVKYTKHTEITPLVSRNIYCLDESVHFIVVQNQNGTARPVGTFNAKARYDIPKSVPSDVQCFFQFTNEYDVNPVRTITKVWSSESFIVKD
jgi:hypothetical protein